jgi:hypothetical protein
MLLCTVCMKPEITIGTICGISCFGKVVEEVLCQIVSLAPWNL